MEQTAEIFLDHGHQAVRLPENIHLPGEQVAVRQNLETGEITLRPVDQVTEEERQKTLDDLFSRLAEVPQEERDLFMAHRDREKQLYAELAEQAAKPATLDRFFKIQQEVGPGEEDFLADRDTSPARLRDVF